MENKIPTIEEIGNFLKEYGWSYRESPADTGQPVLIAPYALDGQEKGILLSFHIEGEFVMVSTIDMLDQVPNIYAESLFSLNDTIKLVKIYSVPSLEPNTLDVNVGFELWGESWNKNTFFAFLDMLCLGIEKTLKFIDEKNISHQTKFVTFSKTTSN
jgi:hypothetical protein